MKLSRLVLPLLATAVSVMVACGGAGREREGFDGEGNVVGGNPAQSSGGSSSSTGGITPVDPSDSGRNDRCQKMDILFVVDDSGSMADEQAKLAENFQAFADTINDFTTDSGAKLDWRVGITTTGRDVKMIVKPPFGPTITVNEEGDNGELRPTKCGGADRRWIERDDPDAVADFRCRARVGTNGSGTEMPLETARLALTDRMGDTNAGFLRDDALLAIVILTDEDDHSTREDTIEVTVMGGDPEGEPIANYIEAFNTIAKGANRWATAVIAAPQACGDEGSQAADRLRDFVDAAGDRGKFSSICVSDLTPALLEALATFDAACNEFPPPEVN